MHAVIYPPHHPHIRAEGGERVRYTLCLSPGPGAKRTRLLDMVTVFFTSRGLGVADIDCRGSSGYGRPYREHVYGQWGVADVEDCALAARELVSRWNADPARLVVRGAGPAGATALATLAHTDACGDCVCRHHRPWMAGATIRPDGGLFA